MKYYIANTYTKPPDVLIHDKDWDDKFNTEAWIGCSHDTATNTNKEYWIEDEYVHHVFQYKFIYYCMTKYNLLKPIPRDTKLYLKKQCAL